MSVSYRRTTIENLSNELFYEIFDYLDGCDILNGFSKLNSRFQYLLSNPSVSFKINLITSTNLEHNCRTNILPNSSRIRSLKFADEFLLDSFLSICPLNQTFENLRQLHLNSLPAYKLTVLLIDCLSLTNLVSLTCSLTSCFVDVSYIYRLIFRFRTLKIFQLSLPLIEDLDDFEQALFVVDKHQFSSIEHLKIDHCCTIDDFLSILSCLPNLKSLSCQTLFQANEYVEKHVHFSVPNLTSLIIEKCLLKFDLLEMILNKIARNLKRFRIVIRHDDFTYLDAQRWQTIICQTMPNLKNFRMKYYEYFQDQFKQSSFHKLLDRFFSSFWHDKNWIFNLELTNNDLIYSIDSSASSFDTHYHCSSSHAETFHEYFSTIFSLLNITCLSIDCSKVPLLICVKLLRLLPNLHSLKISSLCSTEAKRLSTEKSKILQSIAFNNKIINVHLDELLDFGQIQFLVTLCPSMELFRTSFRNLIDLQLFLQWIFTKQSTNLFPRLDKLILSILHATNQIVDNLVNLIEFQKLLFNYRIQRLGDQISLSWNL